MKRNYYKSCLVVLTQLHKDHPSYEMGKHISTALADYGDAWSLPDKELFHALKKYQSFLALDKQDITEAYIQDIIEDGSNLDHILDEKEEEE